MIKVTEGYCGVGALDARGETVDSVLHKRVSSVHGQVGIAKITCVVSGRCGS